jgi:hypothetical protein
MRTARFYLCAGTYLIVFFLPLNYVCLAQPDIGPESDTNDFGYSLNIGSRQNATPARMRTYGRPAIFDDSAASVIETVLVINERSTGQRVTKRRFYYLRKRKKAGDRIFREWHR